MQDYIELLQWIFTLSRAPVQSSLGAVFHLLCTSGNETIFVLLRLNERRRSKACRSSVDTWKGRMQL